MALQYSVQQKVTRRRVDYPQILEYANANRLEGSFVDVTVKVGNISIPANKMILSCCSKVLEKMFKTEMKERYESTVNITADVDSQSVKILIDFIYTGEIVIDNENVMHILAAADYLQLEEVKQFCSEYLTTILTPDNCFDILGAAKLYCT